MKTTYQWEANSNAAPFFSDPSSGFVEANSPMEALKKIVSEYKHPCGLYAATISECSVKNKMLARYLSPKAATSASGGSGGHQWKNGKLFVNDKEVPMAEEKWEGFE